MMADDSSVHLPDETLRQYVRGALAADEATLVREHLSECAACLDRLGGLAPPDFMARHCPTFAAGRSALELTTPAGSTRTEWAGTAGERGAPSGCYYELARHDDYEIIRELGRGGMGVVYLAHNKLMGRHEVLKALDKDLVERPAMRDRFLREIRAVARLRHPNIVAAYSAFRCGEYLVFAMEYVEGLDLARMVRAKGPMPLSHSCHFVSQAALALQHAHEAGLVHRDIKPGNLMLSHTKGRALIKVLDFGLAKANREINPLEYWATELSQPRTSGDELTLAGQFLGTPEYIAPEQIADAQNADIRADIYSLGCTLYYLLSGRAPFPKTSLLAVIAAHRTMAATPLSSLRLDVPAQLSDVVAKMMAKQPDRRFQSPAEVAAALSPFVKKSVETPALTLPGPPATNRPGPNPVPAAESVRSMGATARLSAEAVESHSHPEAIWAKLIELEDSQIAPLNTRADAGARILGSFRWGVPAGVAAGIAVIALAVGMLFLSMRKDPAQSDAPSAADGEPGDRETARAAPVGYYDRIDLKDSSGDSPPKTAQDQGRDANSSPRIAQADSAPVSSTTADTPIEQFGSTTQNRGRTPRMSIAAFEPPLIKARRWDWIHDVSLQVFDRWVEGLKLRGYRPTFVNGHDLATHIHIIDEPQVEGNVRVAAIAEKNDGRIAFQLALDHVEKSFAHYLELIARGYNLTAMTTFTNGTTPLVLAVYSEKADGAAFWSIGSSEFPGKFIDEWQGKGVRPFAVSCRPAGDFWDVNLGTKARNGVDWRLHSELTLAELNETLSLSKASGFKPDSLFVCPGKARGGFGVVLTHGAPDLLWEVRANLSSAQLDSDLTRMAEKGFGPDQIVGYAVDGASRYLACWTRNPGQYPATGLVDPSLEPLDLAVEQFALDHHAANATLAVYRNGRLAMSRGFGHSDLKTRRPQSAGVVMPLAGVSPSLTAAAVHSLIRKQKLNDDEPLARLVGMTPESAGATRDDFTTPPNPPLTLGRLLGRLGDSGPEFDDREREFLRVLAKDATGPEIREVPATDRELAGALLNRILATATGKQVTEAIISELSPVVRLVRMEPPVPTTTKPAGPELLFATAADVGRFFLKNQFDGRPLASKAKTPAGELIGRQGSSLAIIKRRDDLLVVGLLTLGEAPSAEIGDSLRSRLAQAIDRLSAPPSTGKRTSPQR